MAIYINGIGSISAQKMDPSVGVFALNAAEGNRLMCAEPDYKDLVPPMQLRRMSKVVRMGVAAAKSALREAGLERPDVITTGTAYGCLADTEIFLSKLLTQDEAMLTPTSFIQSTHNTVSGQIALMIGCHGHNFTYVHRGHSYESSLQEAQLWLLEQPELNVLCGGVDEMTQHAFEIIGRFGTFKKEHNHFDTPTEGTVAGEGANLFVLSGTSSVSTYAELIDCCLCTPEPLSVQLDAFLQLHGLTASEIDLCLCGLNGDVRYDGELRDQLNAIPEARLVSYKKWSGEYPTAGSFGLTLAAMILRHGVVPAELMEPGSDPLPPPRLVLVHNHYKNQYHSLVLLRKVSL